MASANNNVVGFSQRNPPFRKGVSNSTIKKVGVQQAITVTMRSGRNIFTGPPLPADISTEKLLEPVFEEALNKFIDETIRANIQALDIVIQKMIVSLLPTVALKTGKLRNAMTGMLYAIKSNFNTNNAILLAGLDDALKQRNITITEMLIDFQQLFAQVEYAIYHAIEFRNVDTYARPTTKGTKPYSIQIFFNIFIKNMSGEILDSIQLTGWDISMSSGTGEIIIDSIGVRGRLPG